MRLHIIKICLAVRQRGVSLWGKMKIPGDVLARYHSSISAMGHESQWSGGAQVSPGPQVTESGRGRDSELST